MCKAFYYKKYDFDTKTGLLSLTYECGGYTFLETITFPGAPFSLDNQRQNALNQILFLTHIAFGISYYKAFLPPDLIIETGTLTRQEAAFFDTFYLNGLGEFSIKNNVNLDIHFPYDKSLKKHNFDISLSDKTLVPVGGGKDSCVTLELLKKTDKSITAFSVGNARPIKECVQKSGLNHLILTRQISPQLIELNKTHKILNGHVPITGLIAFLLWICGILYDFKYVAMSCEQSANSGNIVKNGRTINHQYSKSIDFEKDFYKLTHSITPEFHYFSLLRPLTEIHIAELFSSLCSSYFDVFTSCNKAFKLDEAIRLDRWCGMCDKCRFVFLILAPFMNKNKLIEIVGKNPLNDMDQLKGYEELLGLSGHKPFECVGEVNECRWAFEQLKQNPLWRQDVIIQKLSDKITQKQEDIFNISCNHLIPESFKNVMAEFKQ